jgi:Rhs element Vgr protein
MADNPGDNAARLVTFKVYSDGTQIKDDYEFKSISVTKEINRIGSATLEILAGNMPDRDFPLSNTDTFKPGKSIKIDAGYESEDETIYEGIIISHGLRLSSGGDSLMIIECRDFAIKATAGRKNAVYEKKKDSDVISTVLGNYSDLTSSVDATTYQYEELIQYYCTDWDFILSRADINGLVVISDDKNLSVKKPAVTEAAVIKVTYGENLIDFDGEVDAEDQYNAVQACGWDQTTQAIITSDGSAPSLNAQGNLSQTDLSGVLNLDKFILQSGINVESSVLKNWADALLLKYGLARFRGSLTFQGNSKAKPGCIVEVDGLGDRFNGNTYVGSVTHNISNGDWKTTVGLGIDAEFISQNENLVSPSASGLLPGIEGLQIGKVSKLDGDPAGENRIQVKIPILNSDTDTVWARMSQFYASNQFGSFFVPEIDDEVILGFFNNDPRHPVILGSLYSSKLPPPYELAAENNTKAIVTRTKMTIEFDEDKKVITIKTPGENQIVISDDAKSIKLSDQNKNVIEMNADGITIDSCKDVIIKAKANIKLTATSNIETKSTADTKIKGLNITGTADVGMTMKGSATAEFSASGQTTIKGAIVMIN